MSGSMVENNPEVPLPTTIDGVVLSSEVGVDINLSFFCADMLRGVGVVIDLGVTQTLVEGVCWNSPWQNSWNPTLPSQSTSNFSNNCCSS